MPLNTNFSVAPYFDDYDNADNYYKILFKPSTAVQVREMNQLQTILQNQIEEFGDHILKSGTVLDGCQFSFKNSMPYVKILDTTVGGAAVDVNEYQGLFALGETTGVIGEVEYVLGGFEGNDDAELKTLYMRYVDSGTNEDKAAFDEGETLKIYSNQNSLYDIDVALGGASQGFSNSDIMVVLSAIRVQNVTSSDTTGLTGSGKIEVGATLNDADSTISVVVYDTPVFDEETQSLIVPIRPVYSDLAPIPDKDKWENITAGETVLIRSGTPDVECTVVAKVGSGATGTFTTTRTGSIASADITRGGSGYTTLPYVSIYSTVASTAQVTALDLTPIDFVAKVTVATSAKFADPVGFGYGVAVSDGKIYQKGYFLNVEPQFSIVSRYSNTPSDLSVGFSTTESVVNVSTDSALYDNAQGYLNFAAPGANRLKLTPIIATKTSVEEAQDPEFLPIIRFSEGKPFSQNKLTQFNKLGDMIAQRTYEESGNYTLDRFEIATKSTVEIANSDTHFCYVVDPGHAYVKGYRVKTDFNFTKTVEKAKEVKTTTGEARDLTYSNYFRVNNLAGVTLFKTGQDIEFYDKPIEFYRDFDELYTGGGVANTLSFGERVGTAKIRSVVHESGIQGTEDAVYRIHFFDYQNEGKAIKNIRSVYVPEDSGVGGGDGVADIVLSPGLDSVFRTLKNNATSPTYKSSVYNRDAVVQGPDQTSLVLDLNAATTVIGGGNNAISNVDYQYRTTDVDLTVSSTGQITVTTSDAFPYIATLTSTEEDTLLIVPQVDIQLASFETGVTMTADLGPESTILTSSVVTTSFIDDLVAGDFITNGTTVTQVLSVDAQNQITVRNTDTSFAGSGLTLSRIYPKDVPISLANRIGASASVSGSNMTISLGASLSGGDLTNAVAVTYNVKSENTPLTTMSATRSVYVQVSSSTMPACLGVPGVFRLRKVYNGTAVTDTDITSEFYVESGQTSSYWGLDYLARHRTAPSTLSATILVQFDYFVPSASGGLKTIDSYDINDEVALSSLTTDCNILEVPSFVDDAGGQHWLRECMDFRPFVETTVTPNAAAASAPLVSSTAETFAASSGLKFPIPEGDVEYDLKVYQPRRDIISIDIDGQIKIATGTTNLDKTDGQKLDLYKSRVRPYPSLPKVLSKEMSEILDTRVVSKGRGTNFLPYVVNVSKMREQNRGYTMADIATLERRIDALEINQNLSLLENSTKDLNFPSSVDTTLNRFKFGFFVDNFENFKQSNRTDSAYAASIYEYVLQPAKSTVNLQLKPGSEASRLVNGDKISFPFTRRILTSQTNATYGPYIAPPPPPSITNEKLFFTNNNNNFIGKTVATYEELRNVWEEITVVGAGDTDGVSRNIEIYFYNPDGGIAYEVIQSKTPPTAKSPESGLEVFTSEGGTVQNITSSEGFEKYQLFYPAVDSTGGLLDRNINPWFAPRSTSTLTTSAPTKTYTTQKGAGKITIQYDHTKGRYITVRVLKAAPYFNFEITYPATTISDAVFDSGQTTVDTTPPCPEKGGFRYQQCEGTALVTYVHDGLCGTIKGSTTPNSSQCIEPEAPPIDPEPAPCPAFGTFFKDACQGDNKVVYVYTGLRGDDGLCETEEDSSTYSTDCAPPAPPPSDPEPDDSQPEPDDSDDDGTTNPADPDDSTEEEVVITPDPEPEPDPPPPPPPPKPVKISIGDANVNEGEDAIFVVSLDKPSAKLLTVNYTTADGTATAGSDYTAKSGKLTIPAGQTEGRISVTTLTDALAGEGTETFTVALSNQNQGIVDRRIGTGTIQEATSNPTVYVAIPATTVDSVQGFAYVTVTLSGTSASTITVDYATADGEAKDGFDYTAESGTLTFEPGERTKRVSIPLLPTAGTRDFRRYYRDFSLTISNATNATLGNATAEILLLVEEADEWEYENPPLCFLAGTQILLANGDTKNIEHIVPDDIVVGFDEHKSQNKVLNIIQSTNQTHTIITMNDRVRFTEAHSFLTTSGWKAVNPDLAAQVYCKYDIEVGQLEIGDEIITINNNGDVSTETVRTLDMIVEEVEVYNFEVDGDNTYVAEGFVTHNKTPPPPPPEPPPPPPPAPPAPEPPQDPIYEIPDLWYNPPIPPIDVGPIITLPPIYVPPPFEPIPDLPPTIAPSIPPATPTVPPSDGGGSGGGLPPINDFNELTYSEVFSIKF